MTQGAKERPILFSAPMVRAILAGRKTVTRRIVKWPEVVTHYTSPPLSELTEVRRSRDDARVFIAMWGGRGQAAGFRAPFVVGDRLWVRETFAAGVDGRPGGVSYRADHVDPNGDGPANPMKWKPSIFMRRRESRLFLEITGVRVERLHAISEQDAIAEGCDETNFPRDAFAELWDTINAKRGGWTANPWVWRVAFKVLRPANVRSRKGHKSRT